MLFGLSGYQETELRKVQNGSVSRSGLLQNQRPYRKARGGRIPIGIVE